MKTLYLFSLAVLLLFSSTGCSVEVPATFGQLEKTATIYPDYRDITVPCNIAPLNFRIREEGEEFITRITGNNGENITVAGEKMQIPLWQWKALTERNKNSRCQVEIFVRLQNQWFRYKPFGITVAPEPIDEYLSYRLIEPSYVTYEVITINQRNLTNFDESEIYNNSLLSVEMSSHCINCHSYQNYDPHNMQIHSRQAYGGTLVISDGKMKKVDMKTDKTVSGGVYPAWHPTRKLIAYSVNNTSQSFHTKDLQKVEVQDSHSDLILYDLERNSVTPIVNDTNDLEVFPAWSPDGTMLYYVCAHFDFQTDNKEQELLRHYKEVKYDLYRIPFDTLSYVFGQPETVFQASAIGKSATLPRVSPNGRYLLFTLGDFGVFHIWHKSSDLHLIDLKTGKERKVEQINSPDVESYHSWSSNGRWIIFSSRRDDGAYTRPYIAYFDSAGIARKPFILPQEDPDFYPQFYKSFNIPEFMKEAVPFSAQDFAKGFRMNAQKVIYQEQ